MNFKFLICSAILLCCHQPAIASTITDAGKDQRDTANLSRLMVIVGQSRELALKGCPAAVELIIRSYNAYIYREQKSKSYMDLLGQVDKCKSQ